jgi:type I restriction enzyme S subunit
LSITFCPQNDNLEAVIETIYSDLLTRLNSGEYIPLKNLITVINIRNQTLKYGIDSLIGVSLNKQIIASPANKSNLDVSNYKVLLRNQFACNLMHVGRDKKVAIAKMSNTNGGIISPAFTVFEVQNANELNPDYLITWFSRKSFDEKISYLASEGIRDGIKWETFSNVAVFVPNTKTQCIIASIYTQIHNNFLEIQSLKKFAGIFINKLAAG